MLHTVCIFAVHAKHMHAELLNAGLQRLHIKQQHWLEKGGMATLILRGPEASAARNILAKTSDLPQCTYLDVPRHAQSKNA